MIEQEGECLEVWSWMGNAWRDRAGGGGVEQEGECLEGWSWRRRGRARGGMLGGVRNAWRGGVGRRFPWRGGAGGECLEGWSRRKDCLKGRTGG